MLKKLFGWTNKTAHSGNIETERLAIDPDLRYCPECEDEYQASIKRCVSCDRVLISGAEKLENLSLQELAFNGRLMNINVQHECVVIRNGKLRDLKLLQILLETERIPTIISGESAGGGKG
jgi:hypothetical protein